jgi:uncharacterized protein with HEPN domain
LSKRLIELFLFDVIVAISKIEHVVSRVDSVDELKHDFMAWDTVIREFEIIGEASKHLLKSRLLEEDHRPVVDFRNVLIHEYFGIDEDEVWGVIHYQLHTFEDLIFSKIKLINAELKQEIIDALLDENAHLLFIVNTLKQI